MKGYIRVDSTVPGEMTITEHSHVPNISLTHVRIAKSCLWERGANSHDAARTIIYETTVTMPKKLQSCCLNTHPYRNLQRQREVKGQQEAVPDSEGDIILTRRQT